MKKYFTKFIVAFLLVATFQLTIVFCAQGLLGDCDHCESDSVTKMTPSPLIDGQHSLMPCCQPSAHPEAVINSQSAELAKFIGTIFFLNTPPPEVVKTIIVFNPLIIPPPKLLALKVTVLRL
ncbi:MAG: hypothetical protein ACOYMB_02025 [Patescibacteria group bacterium]